MTFSIVIPTLNEADQIFEAVGDVVGRELVDEVIVVDGGSADETVSLAIEAGATVVHSGRGRGLQQNAGAAAATSENLLFLHADVRLPNAALELASETLARTGVVAGAFRTWHRAAKWKGRCRAALLHLADVRSRYSPLPYGDQALFVSAETFNAVGGFPELPLMEDLALARALSKRGKVVVAAASVAVSGRRFESAPIFQTALVNLFPLLYYCGVPPRLLAKLYGDPR